MAKLLIIAAVVAASGAFSSLALIPTQQSPPPPPPPPEAPAPAVSPISVASGLGFTPEVLAAAGVNGTQTAAILANLADSATLVAALEGADESASSAGAALTAAQEAARGPFATEESPATVAAAADAYEAALAARTAARAALFDAATSGLGSEVKARLAHAATGLVHSVPISFTVVERSPEAWLDIQSALVAEARAARMSTTLSEDHATLLAAVRAEQAVIAAEMSLDGGLAGVQAAFAAATAPGGN